MAPNPFDLTGRVALVTGGGTGLGFAMARSLINAGAVVIITGRRLGPLQTAQQHLGAQCRYFQQDVTELSSLPAFVELLQSEVGPLDILINNAGINQKKPSVEVTDEEFAHVLHTNLHAVFALTREVAKGMLERRRGSILFISSMAALYGIDRVVAYTAAKSALVGMVRGLTSEYAPHGVRVNAIAPGFIETDMVKKAFGTDTARHEQALRRTPMGRLGQPDEIGDVAAFLASDAARFVTGITLPVDGGNAIGW
jgi:gluconate 5-dehydrogenase